MRAVDACVACGQHLFALVGAERTLGAHGQLMAYGNATGRTHNPIPAVALVELRSFGRAVFRAVSVEHNHGIANLLHAVGTHLTNGQNRIELATRVGPTVHQIALTVLVPKRRCVDHALAGNDALRFRPLAFRVFRGSYKNAQIGISPVDIIGLIVLIIANAGCPYAIAMLRNIVALQRRQCLDSMVHNLPVHQVLRMKNRQTGNAVERGSRQIEVFTGSTDTDVWVTIVGIDDGIRKGAVAIVRAPHLRFVLRLHHEREQ